MQSICLLAAGTAGAAAVDWQDLILSGGGAIGFVIMALSLFVGSLVIQQFLYLRTENLAPTAMVEDLRKLIDLRQGQRAVAICQENPCFLASVVEAGLREVDLDYEHVEKAMEEVAVEQSSKLYRRLEYINIVGTIAPMLGLLGTVWGMILAFAEFAVRPNPSVGELAPGIYHALVTTMFGLTVAIPSMFAYGLLRNRAEAVIVEASLRAQRVFSGYKRMKFKSARNAAVKVTHEVSSEDEPTVVEL